MNLLYNIKKIDVNIHYLFTAFSYKLTWKQTVVFLLL